MVDLSHQIRGGRFLKKNKIISLILTFSLLFSFCISPIASIAASPEGEPLIINGIEFITLTEDKFEYLYEKEGVKYKNIEYIDNNIVQSYIYKYNPDIDEYSLVDELKTTVTEEKVKIEFGESKTTLVDNPFNGGASTNSVPPPEGGGSDFSWSSTTSGSSKAAQFTLAAIAITITIVTKVPKTASWVLNMAALYFSFGKDLVYYRYDYYKKGSGISTQTKVITQIYSDSARTNRLGASAHISDRNGITQLWAN